MINDDNSAAPVELTPDERYGETLLYDFVKFMTTLSLFALGGVLTITQTADLGDLKVFNIVMSLAAITIAGMLSLSTANTRVEARSRGREPRPETGMLIKVATGFLGLGTGAFLMMWIDSLR